MPFFRRKHAKFPGIDNAFTVGFRAFAVGEAVLFHRALHHRQARIHALARAGIKMTFEDAGRCGVFIPERRGSGVDTIGWNTEHTVPFH